MKNLSTPLAAMATAVLVCGCADKPDPFSTEMYSDLVINEVAAHDEQDDVASWIELSLIHI